MQPPRGLDPRVLAIVAILGLVGGCWLAGTTASPDDRLVSLLGRLTALQSTSIVVASAIVSAAAIAAAVLIPLVTVWAIRRGEEPPPAPTADVPAKALASPPEARKGLRAGEEARALPTPRPAPAQEVERRSTITPAPPDQPQGTA